MYSECSVGYFLYAIDHQRQAVQISVMMVVEIASGIRNSAHAFSVKLSHVATLTVAVLAVCYVQ